MWKLLRDLYVKSTRDFYVEMITCYLRRNEHVISTYKLTREFYVEMETCFLREHRHVDSTNIVHQIST